jgi:hypothetical protein
MAQHKPSRTISDIARDLRSKVERGVTQEVLVQETHREGTAPAAALRLAIWQLQGEIAGKSLGGPPTTALETLKEHQRTMLRIHAKGHPAQHDRLRKTLHESHSSPGVSQIHQRIANAPAARRAQADFPAIIRAYLAVGGFLVEDGEAGRDAEQPPQAGFLDRPRLTTKDTQAGISRFRINKSGASWRQILRYEHALNGTLPVPTLLHQLLGDSSQQIPLRIVRKSHGVRAKSSSTHGNLSADGSYITLQARRWRSDFFPGMILRMSWASDPRKLIATARLLDQAIPVRGEVAGFVGQPYIAYEHDRGAVVRETAPGGAASVVGPQLSPAGWVLRALHILGYLSDDGRVVLAEESLERNLVTELDYPPGQLHRIGPAVQKLLDEGRISQVVGSRGARGIPIYPPVWGRPPVQLLSYSPFLPPSTSPEHQKQSRTSGRGPHAVSGFLRRLPDGQTHSEDAAAAYEDAQLKAEIANRRPLEPDYTFVRKHHRRG